MIKSYTMNEYLDAIKNESFTAKSLFLNEMIGDDSVKMIVHDRSILRFYRNEILEQTAEVTLNTAQCNRYFYKPWLFCYDTYGTAELWVELLDLNQVRSFSEFNHETIRVFPPNILSLIKSIMDLETEVTDLNTSEMLAKTKEVALS